MQKALQRQQLIGYLLCFMLQLILDTALQGRQRAMSRAECDAFNHMHFARLQSAHGKRGVTPKVPCPLAPCKVLDLLYCVTQHTVR